MAADDGMKKADIDPERLAALLDGRLDARAHAALVAELAASDDATLDALADAVAVTGELQHEGLAPTPNARAEMRRASAPWSARRFALAAAIAAVLLVPWGWLRMRDRGPASPAQLASAVTGATIPNTWEGAPWSALRGPGTAPSRDTIVAVRVGSHAVDLEIATRAGDPRAAGIAREIANLLSGVGGAGPAAGAYERIADAPGGKPTLEAIEQAWRAAAPMLDPRYVEIGAWLEAARLAATRDDVSFFRSRESTRLLDRTLATGGPRLPEATSRALQEARRLAAGNGRIDAGLAAQLTEALGALGTMGGN